MKFNLLSAGLSVVIGFASVSSYAADLTELSRATPHDALYDMAWDGDQGIAVGARGLVMLSGDGGKSWAKGLGPENDGLAMLSVASLQGRKIAVGQLGTAFRLEGDKWTALKTGTTARLLTVALGDNGLAVTAGAFGTLLVSGNDGNSWTPVVLDWFEILQDAVEPNFYDIAIVGDTITVVGEFNLVLQSRDRGVTWAVVQKGGATLSGLSLGTDGVGIAVGQTGTVLRTSDGGATWQQAPTNVTTNLLGVATSGQNAFATGFRIALQSSDGGATWQQASFGDLKTEWYSTVTKAPANANFILVGHSGRIAEVTN